jgi:hypothetical protein
MLCTGFYLCFKLLIRQKLLFSFVITLAITTTYVATMCPVHTVEANKPPKLGNPHDFRPGPPIPSCSADFHQGPPDDDIKGCRDTQG